MGLGKEKARKKALLKKKNAKKRKNNAQIVHAYRAQAELEAAAGVDDEESGVAGEAESAKPLSGREKHAQRVQQKRLIREMLNNKKAERLMIRKSVTDGDMKSIRRGMCDEIKALRSAMKSGGSSSGDVDNNDEGISLMES